MSTSSRRTLLSLAGSGALVAVLAACANSNPPMAGTAAGTTPDTGQEGAARDQAGQGCPPTSQGLPRLATRGEGPTVLRSGTARGSAGRGTAQQMPPVDSCP